MFNSKTNCKTMTKTFLYQPSPKLLLRYYLTFNPKPTRSTLRTLMLMTHTPEIVPTFGADFSYQMWSGTQKVGAENQHGWRKNWLIHVVYAGCGNQ